MAYEPKWADGSWYRCRVEPGGHWEISPGENKSVYYETGLIVTGGEMAERVLPWRVFVTAKTKDTALSRFNVLGFDAKTQDLTLLEGNDSIIAGRECWARCEIAENRNKPGSFYPARASEIVGLNDRMPGAPAHKAAVILGNIATKAPDADAYADNY